MTDALASTGAAITMQASRQLKGWRLTAARMAFGLGVRLVGAKLVVEPEAPRAFDVAIERAGPDRLLRVGDRAVRLPPRDAEYLGGMLEAGWVGEVRQARVYDVRV